MSTPTLILGNNKWAIEEDSILGYAVEDRNGLYLPREISFTRGSDATYTDSTGVIRQACWNLLQQSETFETGNWSKTACSISTNVTTAPDGTLTADALIEDTSNGLHICGQAITLNSSICTVSIYAKANGRNWMFVSMVAASNYGTYFDLQNGALGTVESNVTATITSVGNGWYRCTLTTTSAVSSARCQVYTATANGVNSYTGNGTSGLFIWGAQLVQGSDALGYLRTTDRLNMPRVDSSTGTKAFLLEPQRTNLVFQSNTFNTTWYVFGGATITSNSTTSPDGLTNATTLNSAGGINDFLYQSFTVNNATTYTVSFFVKNVNSTQSKFYIPLTATPEAFINWSGSTITSVTSSGTNSFTALSNGWYRVAVTATATATGTYIFRIYSDNNNTSKSIYIYGTQLEVGAYPTTYIPTQATTVTRLPDVASKTGISGLIGQTEGTIFLDFIFKTPESNIGGQIGITDSSKNNRVILWNNLLFNTLALQLKANGTNAINNVSLGTFVDGTRYKIALAYKSGDTAVYVNGTQTITNSASFTFASSLSDFTLGTYDTAINVCYQFCYKTELYNTRLTNAELAALTTL